MTLTELESAKPGRSVGHIRHGGSQLVEIDFTRGIVPESSRLAADDAEVFVATDSWGKPDVVVGLEHISDGEADLGIETIDGKDLTDPLFAQKLVIEAMDQSGVRVVNLSPGIAAIPEAALPQIGFQPDASGETYTLSLAA